MVFTAGRIDPAHPTIIGQTPLIGIPVASVFDTHEATSVVSIPGRLVRQTSVGVFTCGQVGVVTQQEEREWNDVRRGEKPVGTPDVRPVGDLPYEIGKTASRELSLHGIGSLMQVSQYTEKELLAIHGVGPKAVRILRERLAEHGLNFRRD